MPKILPFDTETDQMVEWKQPSEGDNQQHLVELAAQLIEEDQPNIIIEEMCVLIRPDGWTWDATSKAFQLHGITFEQAMDEGIPEQQALEQFWAMYEKCDKRTAFNAAFDNRIIRVAQKRYWTTDDADPRLKEWKEHKHRSHCSMLGTQKLLGLSKWPTLAAAMKMVLGREHPDAHRAKPDMEACRDLYFELMRRQAAC